MPGTSVPVIHQPFGPGDRLPFRAGFDPPDRSYLFDTEVDPDEVENRVGERGEARLRDAMAEALGSISAPVELRQRIGLG